MFRRRRVACQSSRVPLIGNPPDSPPARLRPSRRLLASRAVPPPWRARRSKGSTRLQRRDRRSAAGVRTRRRGGDDEAPVGAPGRPHSPNERTRRPVAWARAAPSSPPRGPFSRALRAGGTRPPPPSVRRAPATPARSSHGCATPAGTQQDKVRRRPDQTVPYGATTTRGSWSNGHHLEVGQSRRFDEKTGPVERPRPQLLEQRRGRGYHQPQLPPGVCPAPEGPKRSREVGHQRRRR